MCGVTYPNFNTTLVRFKQYSTWRPSHSGSYFNTTLVRFKLGSLLGNKQELTNFNTTLVRFKLDCDGVCRTVRANFNTTLVRFKHEYLGLASRSITRFQYYTSPIQTNQADFFYLHELQHFNTTLVRFKRFLHYQRGKSEIISILH